MGWEKSSDEEIDKADKEDKTNKISSHKESEDTGRSVQLSSGVPLFGSSGDGGNTEFHGNSRGNSFGGSFPSSRGAFGASGGFCGGGRGSAALSAYYARGGTGLMREYPQTGAGRGGRGGAGAFVYAGRGRGGLAGGIGCRFNSGEGYHSGRGGGRFGGTRSGYFASNIDGFNNQQQQQIFTDFDDDARSQAKRQRRDSSGSLDMARKENLLLNVIRVMSRAPERRRSRSRSRSRRHRHRHRRSASSYRSRSASSSTSDEDHRSRGRRECARRNRRRHHQSQNHRLRQLRKDNDELEQDLRKANGALKAAEAKADALLKENQRIVSDQMKEHEDLANLQKESKRLFAELQKVKTVQNPATAAKQEIEQLKKKLAEATLARVEAERQCKEMRAKFGKNQEKFVEFRQKFQDPKVAVDPPQTTGAQMQTKIDALNAQKTESESDHKQKMTELKSKPEKNVENLKLQIARLIQENELLQKKVDIFEQEDELTDTDEEQDIAAITNTENKISCNSEAKAIDGKSATGDGENAKKKEAQLVKAAK